MTDQNASCEARIDEHLAGRLADLHQLWDQNPETYDDELGNLSEYGLSFDYVEPDTFNDQPFGYYRYQLSWGGPSDEFRFWPHDNSITYHFMDWFDGAKRHTADPTIEAIFDDFRGMGMMDDHSYS